MVSEVDVRRAREQKYRLRQTTSYSSLLVARQSDVSRKLNQAFLLVDSFNLNFVDEEHSDIPHNKFHVAKHCLYYLLNVFELMC